MRHVLLAVKRATALVAVLLLVGCASIYAQRYQEAGRIAVEAIKECRDKRLAGELSTYMASVQCSNPRVIAAYQEAGYPHGDLIALFTAYRLAGTERVDRGDFTEAQFQVSMSELLVRITTEAQNRAHIAIQTEAQRTAAYGALLTGIGVWTQSVGKSAWSGWVRGM